MSIAVRLPEHTAGARRRFISDLKNVVGGANAKVLYMPSGGEGTTPVDGAVSTRVWTHATALGSRITKLGNGFALSFNGTSDYLSTPDANDLSFGNGAADSVMSIFSVVNVTDTAAARVVIAKETTAPDTEWVFRVGATDLEVLLISDPSAAVSAFRASDAAITQGSWTTLATSYDATGGATAANGMTHYLAGALVASTATNNASYVAMENGAGGTLIGAEVSATPANFFSGSIALVMVVAANLSASQHFQLNRLARKFFQI